MNHSFNQYWWIFLVRGTFAVLLGLLALFMPGTAFAGFVIFLGAYMFIDGIFSVIAAITERKTYRNWGWPLVIGLFGILVGIITFVNPFATGVALIYLIALWAIVIGIAEIVWTIRLRKVIKGEGWYIFAGVVSIIFSLLILFYPVAGALTLTVILGIYALIIGIMLISLAIRLKKRHRKISIQ